MITFDLAAPGRGLRVLCLGAHADDIEIGCGGVLLSWIEQGAVAEIAWCVAAAAPAREAECRASADEFLDGAPARTVEVWNFDDGYLPSAIGDYKRRVIGFRDAFNDGPQRTVSPRFRSYV